MRSRNVLMAIGAILVSMPTILLGTSPAFSAEAEPQPTVLSGPLPAGWTEGGASLPRAVACVFEQKGDYVHVTGGDASGHGWWVKVSGCASGQKATVTVNLQQFYSDGLWRTVATGSKSGVYSGGGSANRADARRICSNSSLTTWRSVIDVDLASVVDSPNKTYTAAVNIKCRAL